MAVARRSCSSATARAPGTSENLFTGWYDADLSDRGEAEAAGRRARPCAEAGDRPDVVHTSLLIRAIRTADLALDELGRLVAPGPPVAGGSTSATTAPSRAWTRRQTAERVRRRAGQDLAPLLRRAAAAARRRREPEHPRDDPRYAGARRPTSLPATECLEGRRRAHAAVLVRRHRPRPARRATPCWWPPTATACGPWSSTSTASPTTTSPSSTSRPASPASTSSATTSP